MAGITHKSALIGIRALACPYANALEAEPGVVLLAVRDAAVAGASRMVLVNESGCRTSLPVRLRAPVPQPRGVVA
jgi:hypothetical protein